MKRVVAIFILLAIIAVPWWLMIRMSGRSFSGNPPPLTPEEATLRDELRAHVQKLAGEIGERNVQHYGELVAAADYIEHSLGEAGLRIRREPYDANGRRCENIEAEITGTNASEIFVIGAHYDSVFGSPGANDNGTGVAALLALARRFAEVQPPITLRFVAFPNEEPGHFQTELMGSWVYARGCRTRGDRIRGMISLETVGYFSNEPNSQQYPVPGLGLIYPTTGNFIAFVGNVASGSLVRQTIGSFRQHASLPSQGAALPGNVPGIGWSDHWSFWQHGYTAMMITDTAPFRYPHYHQATDTPDKIDFDSMTRLVAALQFVIADCATAKQ